MPRLVGDGGLGLISGFGTPAAFIAERSTVLIGLSLRSFLRLNLRLRLRYEGIENLLQISS
ncbi:MAG: hypothetical protein HY432_01585 [Candidatus Liptonbacteria bacterium]|nr:hypothetical protein [Candidatus Liptonbacteria bacterium]